MAGKDGPFAALDGFVNPSLHIVERSAVAVNRRDAGEVDDGGVADVFVECVAPGEEYQRVRAGIVEKLRALKDPSDGAPLIGEIFLKEDIYSGPFLKDAPDVVFFPRNLETIAFGDFEFPSNKLVEPAYAISGHHRMNGILFMRGPDVTAGAAVDGAQITDMAPTILSYFGAPRPPLMSGRVVLDRG